MDRRRDTGSVQMGPGAASLILIFVMLALSILAMLTLINARNDEQTSLRSARVTEQIYALEAQAQLVYGEVLTALRELEAENTQDPEALCDAAVRHVNEENSDRGWALTAQGDTLSWDNTDGERTFSCALRVTGDPQKPAEWILHRMSAGIAEGEDEWSY